MCRSYPTWHCFVWKQWGRTKTWARAHKIHTRGNTDTIRTATAPAVTTARSRLRAGSGFSSCSDCVIVLMHMLMLMVVLMLMIHSSGHYSCSCVGLTPHSTVLWWNNGVWATHEQEQWPDELSMSMSMRMMAQAPEHELKPQWAWSRSRSRFVGAGVTPYFGIYVGKHRQGTRLNIKENW
jgi:hypothetical protein